MHMALRAMITVKDCESMRVLRSQSRDGVLTMVAFISGHPSDGRQSVASRRVQVRSPAGSRMYYRIVRSIFAIDSSECGTIHQPPASVLSPSAPGNVN